MGFLSRKQAVVCALLMAMVLAIAQNQSGSCCCSLESLESRLASVESRLYYLQSYSIPSINYPKISQYCTVYLAANGFDDSTRYGYVNTFSGDSTKQDLPRGVTLFELDAARCWLQNSQSFDTYTSVFDIYQVMESLESATSGTIVIGVTSDTAENIDDGSFKKAAGPFFSRYNMNITGVKMRDKFAFILQKGYPKKTVFLKKDRYGEGLKMKIEIGGVYVSGVTFKLV